LNDVMDKSLNEIGKLRNEMRVGFIEVENQMRAGFSGVEDRLSEVEKTIVETQKQIKTVSETMSGTFEKFSQNVEKGFIAVEEALENDLNDLRSEIQSIKQRLNDANL